MSASLQRATAWGELSSSTLRDRASSHAGYGDSGGSATEETAGHWRSVLYRASA
jgi:hypothetical protein